MNPDPKMDSPQNQVECNPPPSLPTDAAGKPAPKAPLYAMAGLSLNFAQIDQAVKLGMMVVVSLVVLAISLRILLSEKYKGERVRWATSGIMAVMAFWLGKAS